ncbi:MAG TPA: H-NS histone family protein [Alcanivoracaceae bacterium]|nr:H-NS histone family protein [Alcanivoracaceae bacterium]
MANMNINLAPLTEEQLEMVIADAKTLLKKRQQEAKEEAKRKIQKIAAEAGVTVEELYGIETSGRRTRRPAAVKFRHPDDPSLTWAGRGKRPLWLVAELEKGRKLEEFEV